QRLDRPPARRIRAHRRGRHVARGGRAGPWHHGHRCQDVPPQGVSEASRRPARRQGERSVRTALRSGSRRTWRNMSPSPDLKERILSAANRNPAPTRAEATRARLWLFAAGIAGAVAIFFIGGGVRMTDRPPSL